MNIYCGISSTTHSWESLCAVAFNPLNSSSSRQMRGKQTAPVSLHRRKAARHRHRNPKPPVRPPRPVCMRLGMADFITRHRRSLRSVIFSSMLFRGRRGAGIF